MGERTPGNLRQTTGGDLVSANGACRRERVRSEKAEAKAETIELLSPRFWSLLPKVSDRTLIAFDQELRLLHVEGAKALKEVGISADLLFCELAGDGISSIQSELLRQGCRAALAGDDRRGTCQVEGRTLDIRTFPVRDETGKVVLGMAAVRDTTEQAASAALKLEFAQKLHTLVDNLDTGILVEDEDRRVLIVNDRFCQLMKVDQLPVALEGKPVLELMRELSPLFFIPEAFEEGMEEKVRGGVAVRGELTYLGDMRILEQDYAPLVFDGQSRGHLWSFRDVTTREQSRDVLQRQADELRALSLVDELTGLYNRRGFLTLATQQLKLCDRAMRSALVVFVDLDGMKRINDELGHEYGDQALIEIANLLRHSFRSSDVIGRLGGDEFVVLALEADPPSQSAIVKRLRARQAEINAQPGRVFELDFSIGAAGYDPKNPEMVEEVMARADGLMYQQKKARRVERKA